MANRPTTNPKLLEAMSDNPLQSSYTVQEERPSFWSSPISYLNSVRRSSTSNMIDKTNKELHDMERKLYKKIVAAKERNQSVKFTEFLHTPGIKDEIDRLVYFAKHNLADKDISRPTQGDNANDYHPYNDEAKVLFLYELFLAPDVDGLPIGNYNIDPNITRDDVKREVRIAQTRQKIINEKGPEFLNNLDRHITALRMLEPTPHPNPDQERQLLGGKKAKTRKPIKKSNLKTKSKSRKQRKSRKSRK